jgi:hypothetical protein
MVGLPKRVLVKRHRRPAFAREPLQEQAPLNLGRLDHRRLRVRVKRFQRLSYESAVDHRGLTLVSSNRGVRHS